MYRTANEPPYKIDIRQAFVDWTQSLTFKTEEELVQISGNKVLSKELSCCLITIFELPSEKFVYLLTLYSDLFNKEVTLLSDSLQPRALLEAIETEAVTFSDKENGDLLLQEVKGWMLKAGYRVSGVRAIY